MEQFRKINGFSNAFWGWGGEDDDLWNRLVYRRAEYSGLGIKDSIDWVFVCDVIKK